MRFRLISVAAILAAMVNGCGGKKTEEHDHGDGHAQGGSEMHEEHAGHEAESEDIEAAFADLGAEDAKLAKAQKTCPVSGEELGGMGTPYKVTHGDKTVFLCCKNCLKKFQADPEKYIAKLEK